MGGYDKPEWHEEDRELMEQANQQSDWPLAIGLLGVVAAWLSLMAWWIFC